MQQTNQPGNQPNNQPITALTLADLQTEIVGEDNLPIVLLDQDGQQYILLELSWQYNNQRLVLYIEKLPGIT